MGSVRRSTTIRDRHRKVIRNAGAPCGICLEPIDYTLPHLDPGAFVVDHILPLNKGGLDVIDNKQPAHRACNRTKSDKLEVARPTGTTATSRAW